MNADAIQHSKSTPPRVPHGGATRRCGGAVVHHLGEGAADGVQSGVGPLATGDGLHPLLHILLAAVDHLVAPAGHIHNSFSAGPAEWPMVFP